MTAVTVKCRLAPELCAQQNCPLRTDGDARTECRNVDGWVKLSNARKWHYFRHADDNHALCHRWALWGNPPRDPTTPDTDENCTTCLRKLRELETCTN